MDLPRLTRRHGAAAGHLLTSLVVDDQSGPGFVTICASFPHPSGRRIRAGPKRSTPGACKTKVVTRGVDVTVDTFDRHCRIKQHLTDGRGLRIDTVLRDNGVDVSQVDVQP